MTLVFSPVIVASCSDSWKLIQCNKWWRKRQSWVCIIISATNYCNSSHGYKYRIYGMYRTQWLRGHSFGLSSKRTRVRILGCSVKILDKFVFTLHCSSSLSCINEYLAIDSGGYVYEQPSRINCNIWLDASPRSWDGRFPLFQHMWWLVSPTFAV